MDYLNTESLYGVKAALNGDGLLQLARFYRREIQFIDIKNHNDLQANHRIALRTLITGCRAAREKLLPGFFSHTARLFGKRTEYKHCVCEHLIGELK